MTVTSTPWVRADEDDAADLVVERDRWGGYTRADELVDVFVGLEEALRARDGHDQEDET